jgi:hypothetical protein
LKVKGFIKYGIIEIQIRHFLMTDAGCYFCY